MGDGLGATHVVSPNVSGAVWVASVLVRPLVASFLDVTAPGSHLPRHIDHATVGSGSMVTGGSSPEAHIPRRHRAGRARHP